MMGDLHGARFAKIVGLAGGAGMFVLVFASITMLGGRHTTPSPTIAGVIPAPRVAAPASTAPAAAAPPVNAPSVVEAPVAAPAAAPVIEASSAAPAATADPVATEGSPTPEPVAASAALEPQVVTLALEQDAAKQGSEGDPSAVSAATNTGSIAAPSVADSGRDAGGPDAGGQGESGLVILQIGDSHTSADFLSGELRRKLQQRYGNGGVGYITAGKPHIGVRSATLKVGVSSGWTYHAIQKSDNVAEFWLSGFNAVTSVAGEALTFTSESPVSFDSIEIETLRQPGGGSIDIVIDGSVKSTFDLDAKKAEPVVLRFKPDGTETDNVRQVEIKTRTSGPVAIASIGIYNKRSGLSYNNIGYPGATVDLVNKFDKTLMADDLRRLNPQIVVISFGTNEASKPNLDLANYEQNYEKVVGKIKAALPAAEIVLIGPPDGAERGPHCSGKPPPDSACHPARSASLAAPAPGSGSSHECDWHTLPKLEGIRGVERKIAERHGFTYWNWASIMPAECGSHQWALATPPLMARDHIHFTVSGYNKSAEQFLETLIPVIEKVRAKRVSSLSRP
jgi:lysophospholipase L1-like esterase